MEEPKWIRFRQVPSNGKTARWEVETLKGDVRVQLRAEFINAFNEAYFPQPVPGATSTTFGQVTASNQSNYARRAQIGVKVVF